MRTVASLAFLASAQALVLDVNVSCPNTPSSYTVNGVENGNLTVTAGDAIWFDINCNSDPFQITNSSGGAFLEANPNTPVTVGSLELKTNASTPALLGYSSNANPAMKGWIIVNPAVTQATAPVITSVKNDQYLPEMNITWSAGSPGSCIFASWRVTFSTGGVVPGCNNLTNVSVLSCKATLNGTTTYAFAVQRVCTNVLANSNISIVSGSYTTVSTEGAKVCQGGSVCNCGNATVCTCQLTQTCNCDYAETCVCQSGVCNGGHANLFVCQSIGNCNKQCAKSCPSCIGATISDFFGSSDSCSDAGIVHASLALLAALFAFSW